MLDFVSVSMTSLMLGTHMSTLLKALLTNELNFVWVRFKDDGTHYIFVSFFS